MILTIPTTSILRNYSGDDSFVVKYISNQLTTGSIEFSSRDNNNTNFSINAGSFEPVEAELQAIIDAGGDVQNYPMVLKIPSSLMSSLVNINLPDRLQYNNGTEVLTYSNWFDPVGRFINDTEDFVYCVTRTAKGTSLTGTQILFMLGLNDNVELISTGSQEFLDLQGV